MTIWSAEIHELQNLLDSISDRFPDLVKELQKLAKTDDENMILLYSRRSLEVLVTDLCESELGRPRKTEPLKGVIDKLNKEEKVPAHIITSMLNLNSLSAYGAHPKEFDPKQVKPVLNNLSTIVEWYLKYKGDVIVNRVSSQHTGPHSESHPVTDKSILVLPFVNISPDPDQEYFSDGLTEEIITDLSHIKDLLVISRNSAMTFKGTKKKTGEIASEVNVRYVLEGSVRKAGNSIRIIAQLIDALKDVHLWAEKYTGTLDDIFDIQEKVSLSIAGTLRIKLGDNEKDELQQHAIDNPVAYDCYKRAYPEISSMAKERLDYGLNLLQKGLGIAGDNALIYSGIALTYFQYANIGFDAEENLLKGEEYLQKALDLNPEQPEAHFALGGVKILSKEGHLIETIDHWQKALNAKPDDPEIMIYLSLVYAIAGQNETAQKLVNRCRKVDPLNPMSDAFTGWYHFFGGRYDIALEYLLAAYALSPENEMHQFFKGLILLYNDRAGEASDFISGTVDESNTNHWSRMAIFMKYAIRKDQAMMASLMKPDMAEQNQRDLQNSYHIATFYAYAGEMEKALYWLENAVNRGFINYPLLKEHDPLLRSMHEDERFVRLMSRVEKEWENFKI